MDKLNIKKMGIHLKVHDISKSREFYEALGFKTVFAYGDEVFRASFGDSVATAPEIYRGMTFEVSESAQFEIAEGHIAVPNQAVFDTPVPDAKLSGMFTVESLVPLFSNPLVELKFPVRHYYWNTVEAAFRDPDGFVVVMIAAASDEELARVRYECTEVEEIAPGVG